MAKIKNIIFDLGGVLINIDYNKTTSAFNAIGYPHFDEMFTQYKVSPLFEAFETGKITEIDFLEEMTRLSPLPVTNKEIITAWNSMILDFRTETLSFLEQISVNYDLYLLSNTNSIHLRFFREIFTRDTGKATLDVYFRKAWYSHEIGLRKPYTETYAFALQQGNMLPGETLFIDDSINNIEAAKAMGISTHLLLPSESIEELTL